MPYREMFLIVFAAIVAFASIGIANKFFGSSSSVVEIPPQTKNTNTNVVPPQGENEASAEVARLKQLIEQAKQQQLQLEQANLQLAQSTRQLPTNPPPPSTGNSATAVDQANVSSKIAALQSKVSTFLADPNKNWQETGLTLFNELWETYKIPRLSDEQNNSLLKILQAMLQDALDFIKSRYKTIPQPQAIHFIDELQKHKKYISNFEQTELEKLKKELKK